jgi:hypothetical protein
MENISNAKIEKLKSDIEKSKEKIAEYQTKLKEQEKLLVTLEDLEIVARFRSRNGNEDLAAKLKNDKQNKPAPAIKNGAVKTEREEAFNESTKNE